MKKKILACLMALVFLCSVLSGCGTAESVSTDGSTSMSKVIGSLGEAFEQKTGIAVTYNATGSGSGIQAVLEGRCDIGLASRALKAEEEAAGLEGTVLAYDGIAVIVNPENSLTGLTLEELAAIYTGEISNWKEVGGEDLEIVAFQRNATSGSQVLMDKLVMGDHTMMDAPAEWIPGEMDTLMEGVRGYEDSASAIGYSVYYYAEDMRMAEGMKIISIEGIEPTDETIGSDEYPLINPYFAVISAEANEPTRVLYDWLVSTDGQMVLEQQGYVPVNKEG